MTSQPETPRTAYQTEPFSLDRSGDTVSPPDFPHDDDAELVRETLRGIMRDPDAPAAAKAQAARTLAEINQQIGRHQQATAGAGGPVKEMNRAEMLAELAALDAQADA